MIDFFDYKVDLETARPNPLDNTKVVRGDSPRTAFTKYNDMLDAVHEAIRHVGTLAPTPTAPWMRWLDTSVDPPVERQRNRFDTAWGLPALSDLVSVDLNGNVGIGTDTPASILDIVSEGADNGIRVTVGADGAAPFLNFLRSRGTPSTPTVVNSGQQIGRITFLGYSGSAYMAGAEIRSEVDGIASAGVLPGRLSFNTRSASGLVERMRITSTGNVGIGCASPVARLVVSDSDGENFEFTTANATYNGGVLEYLNRNVAGTRPDITYLINGVGAHKFYTNGLERLRVTGTGNVGIGTNSPTSKLHISGSGGSSATAFVENTVTGAGNFAALNLKTPAGYYSVGTEGSGRFYIFNATQARDQFVLGSGPNSSVAISALGSGPIALYTNNLERLYVDSTGSVGIGKTPTTQLDVALNGGMAKFGSATGNNVLQVYSSAGAMTQGFWSGGANYLYSSSSLNIWTGATVSTSGPPTAPTGVVHIAADGKVGIGTTTPSGKLEVQGGAAVESRLLSTGAVARFRLLDNFGNASITTMVGALVFETGSVERARIDAGGSLIIGAETSNARLHVQGKATQDVASFNQGGTSNSLVTINHQDPLGTNPLYRPILSFRKGGVTSLSISTDGFVPGIAFYDAQTATGAHAFFVNNVERLRIDSSGRVGIGTSSATTSLDVAGDAIRVRTTKTPASATATGEAGTICWDANFIYVCVATNTWKRSAIATW